MEGGCQAGKEGGTGMCQGGKERGNRSEVCQGGTKEERKRKVGVRDKAEIGLPKGVKEKRASILGGRRNNESTSYYT